MIPQSFQTLLWRRFVLFLAALGGLVQVKSGSILLAFPFWMIAALVQDWEIRVKEKR